MHTKFLRRTVTGAIFLLSPFAVYEAFAMTCGKVAVSNGSTRDDVLKSCGPPAQKKQTVKNMDSASDKAARILDKRANQLRHKRKTITTDIWNYNCGKRDNLYTLTFENDRLTKVTKGGRGHGEAPCSSR